MIKEKSKGNNFDWAYLSVQCQRNKHLSLDRLNVCDHEKKKKSQDDVNKKKYYTFLLFFLSLSREPERFRRRGHNQKIDF